MKRIFAGVAALAFLAVAAPALADRDDHHRDRDYDHGRHMYYRMPPPPRRRVVVYRENQIWYGHHIHYRGGHWGYYQPQNGITVFINIPL